jgi:hypothetical protein
MDDFAMLLNQPSRPGGSVSVNRTPAEPPLKKKEKKEKSP